MEQGGDASEEADRAADLNTIEEATSSTDEAVVQRKRARFNKGSSPYPIMNTKTDTSLHLHITLQTP